MSENLSITKYITGIEEVFNPHVAYKGAYGFSAEVFSMVSNYSGGRNLVEEFLEKKFFSQIRSILQRMNFNANPRLFVMSDVAGNYGRELTVSAHLFIMEFANILTNQVFDFSDNEETLKDEATQFFRNYRKQLYNIQKGIITDENRDINAGLKNEYQANEDFRKQALGNSYKPLSYTRYIELKIDYLTSFIVGLRYLIPLFNKPIDLNELEACLDLDKFYLAMAKQLIDVTKSTLETDKAIHNSFVFVEKYIMAIKLLREEGIYNLTVDTIDVLGQVIKCNVDDIIREYNEIKLAHPEFAVYSFDSDGRDYRDMDVIQDFTSELNDYVESRKLEASWNFIRNGNKEGKTVDAEVVSRLKVKKEKKKISRDEKLQAVVDRMNFLDYTNYIYKMTGKDQFEGYVGYIYENGVVVFEKFYKSLDNHEPSISNATYVMTFNNFVEMSKLTKTAIMTYIKDGGTDVRRVYHTSKWVDKMTSIITGKTYDEEAMNKINRLINEGKISKVKK